jgi:hypothetical protein
MTGNPVDLIEQLQRLRDFARRLLDPEDLGHSVCREVKTAARRALYGEEDTPRNNQERSR